MQFGRGWGESAGRQESPVECQESEGMLTDSRIFLKREKNTLAILLGHEGRRGRTNRELLGRKRKKE